MSISPYQVTAPEGKVKLFVMSKRYEEVPSTFALMCARAEDKVAIRIAGGCKNMDDSDKKQMILFFLEAFRGYKGVILSGATREVNDGETNLIVTEVPGHVAHENPGSIALGTVPRTAIMYLQDESRLVLDDYGTAPNPGQSAILIVQESGAGLLDWDGDLGPYFEMMTNLKECAGFRTVGVVSWNGGEVTEKEIFESFMRGWPTFLIKGSGRVTDEIIAKIQKGDLETINKIRKIDSVSIVGKDDPAKMHYLLAQHNFLG